jgi:hypothetical protein
MEGGCGGRAPLTERETLKGYESSKLAEPAGQESSRTRNKQRADQQSSLSHYCSSATTPSCSPAIALSLASYHYTSLRVYQSTSPPHSPRRSPRYP